MGKKEILTIIGARPQFIKASVLSRALLEHRTEIIESILHTGQHYDENLSDIFFQELSLPKPYRNLGIAADTHGMATGRMLEKIEVEILERNPGLVLVYGDTNTTLAASLAAAKLHVPVAHIEAGMRSYDMRMPEEINRIVTDRLSSLLFCPSETSRSNLSRENIHTGVFVVGDIMYDAFCRCRDKLTAPAGMDDEYVLATIHRAETTDNPEQLRDIFDAMGKYPGIIVLPLHPRTRKKIKEFGLKLPGNIDIREPVSYLTLLSLVKFCRFVMTDSGGLQKEAFYLGRKCLCLRNETEWLELADIGVLKIVGHDTDKIVQNYDWSCTPLPLADNPYGDGNTAEKIINRIREFIL